MRGFVLLLLIFNLKILERTQEGTMRELSREVSEKEEMKNVQFNKYDETSFSDSGSGIKVEDWDKIVDSLVSDYDIPKGRTLELKEAKLLKEGELEEYRYSPDEEKKDEFAYVQIVVGKENGLMSYKLAGSQVDFKLKQVVKTKTTVDLYIAKFESVRDHSVPLEVEDNEEEYLNYKDKLSEGLGAGFKDKRSSDYEDRN